MVRALSWSTLLWLYLLFLLRLAGWETERPEAWREKFHSRAFQTAVKRERKPRETNILGYEPGRSTAGITATLGQVLSKAAEWGVEAFCGLS